jgi:hypothetical protein
MHLILLSLMQNQIDYLFCHESSNYYQHLILMNHFDSFKKLIIMTIKLAIHTNLQSILEIFLIKDYKQGFIFVTFHSFD